MNVMRDDRSAALHTVLLALHVWQRESGIDRDDARHEAQAAIRYFRRFHIAPERAAFEAAVARSHTQPKAA